MGNHLSGITCTPMGIYSQSFYVAMSLLSSPDANAYCAEFVVLSTCHCFGLFVTIMASKEDIQQLVKQKSDRISLLETKNMLIYQIYTFAVVSYEPV